MTNHSRGMNGARPSSVEAVDKAVGEAIARVLVSPTLAFPWDDRSSTAHEARAGLYRRVLGQLLLDALAPPAALSTTAWSDIRGELAGVDSWPTSAETSCERVGVAVAGAGVGLSPIEPTAVGHVYERWVAVVPRLDETGVVRLDGRGASRKTAGSFYTPLSLARRLASETLAAPLETKPPAELRIVDPACGTGAFLLAALDVMCAQHADSRGRQAVARQHLLRALHGVDRDAVALGLARVVLWLSAFVGSNSVARPDREAAAETLRRQLLVGDALTGPAFGDEPAELAAAPDDARALDWRQAFPEAARAGGFDAVLGNPPWDKVKPFAREFFAERYPKWQRLTRHALDAAIERELAQNRDLAADWKAHQEGIKTYAAHLRSRFRHGGKGDANLYKAFLERALGLAAPHGRIGLVLPYAVCIDLGAADLRRELLAQHAPLVLRRFDNLRGTFGMSNVMNFVTLVAAGRGQPADGLQGIRVGVGDGPLLDVPVPLVRLVAPASYSIPEVADADDVLRLRRLYEGAPLLGGTDAGPEAPSGRLRVRWLRELDMTLDRARFNVEGDGLPIYEGKMIHQYRIDWAGRIPGEPNGGWIKDSPPLDKKGLARPRYWIRPERLRAKGNAANVPHASYRCAVRLIQNSRNTRVLIATVLPPGVAAGNSLATAIIERPSAPVSDARDAMDAEILRDHLFLCGWLNDDAMDWLIRLKIDANLNIFHLKQLPWPREAAQASGDDAYAERHRHYGVATLVRLMARSPNVYGDLAARVTAPDDAWSVAARADLRAANAPVPPAA